jgi:hypothetical protein
MLLCSAPSPPENPYSTPIIPEQFQKFELLVLALYPDDAEISSSICSRVASYSFLFHHRILAGPENNCFGIRKLVGDVPDDLTVNTFGSDGASGLHNCLFHVLSFFSCQFDKKCFIGCNETEKKIKLNEHLLLQTLVALQVLFHHPLHSLAMIFCLHIIVWIYIFIEFFHCIGRVCCFLLPPTR